MTLGSILLDRLMDTIEDMIRRIEREELARDGMAREHPPAREVVVVDSRRLYSVAAVAELLDVSRSYVYSRINYEQLAVVELAGGGTGGKQRISTGELDRFIRSRACEVSA